MLKRLVSIATWGLVLAAIATAALGLTASADDTIDVRVTPSEIVQQREAESVGAGVIRITVQPISPSK